MEQMQLGQAEESRKDLFKESNKGSLEQGEVVLVREKVHPCFQSSKEWKNVRRVIQWREKSSTLRQIKRSRCGKFVQWTVNASEWTSTQEAEVFNMVQIVQLPPRHSKYQYLLFNFLQGSQTQPFCLFFKTESLSEEFNSSIEPHFY